MKVCKFNYKMSFDIERINIYDWEPLPLDYKIPLPKMFVTINNQTFESTNEQEIDRFYKFHINDEEDSIEIDLLRIK